jgi:hypothetical protein
LRGIFTTENTESTERIEGMFSPQRHGDTEKKQAILFTTENTEENQITKSKRPTQAMEA